MMLKLFLVFLGAVVTDVCGTIVQDEWRIYYDIRTNQTIDIIDTNNPRSQYYKSKSALPRILRIGFGPIPCSCESLTCGCCSGINIKYFNYNRKACMNFTYDPYEFSLNVDMLMNDTSLFTQSISGKNPPPACLPFPLPPPAPPIELCVKFFNVHTPGYNLFMCMDFETRILRAPILILHFDCMQMGVDGIHHHKPDEVGVDIEDVDSSSPSEIEVYDEVFEEEGKSNVTSTAAVPPPTSTESVKEPTRVNS